YAQLQQQPQKQPLRPAEIPMKLPVRLMFGFQQPQLEQAQIRRQPQEQNIPCDRCPRCDAPRGQCQCPPTGTTIYKGLQAPPSESAPIDPDAPPSPVYSPPTPVPDAEAYYGHGRGISGQLAP